METRSASKLNHQAEVEVAEFATLAGTNSPIGGYVLAGGRSSRMGTEKALLELAGKPLIEHAVTKLRRFCADVHILSGNPGLAVYAPLVPDLHPDCGPVGGIEAALDHCVHDWVLILPVDVPFLPAIFLESWAIGTIATAMDARIAMFIIHDRPQPALCLLHKEVAPTIAAAIERGEFTLLSALAAAGDVLAAQRNLPLEDIFRSTKITGGFQLFGWEGGDGRPIPTEAQQAAIPIWFANLNTPSDFARAEAHVDALDP